MSKKLKITPKVRGELGDVVDEFLKRNKHPSIIKEKGDVNDLIEIANYILIRNHYNKTPKKGVVPQLVKQFLSDKGYSEITDVSGVVYWIKTPQEEYAN